VNARVGCASSVFHKAGLSNCRQQIGAQRQLWKYCHPLLHSAVILHRHCQVHCCYSVSCEDCLRVANSTHGWNDVQYFFGGGSVIQVCCYMIKAHVVIESKAIDVN
jgi:hypothetical protein